MRPALLLAVGIAAGRFVVPWLEPLTTHYVSITPDNGDKQCAYALITTSHNLGKLKAALGFRPAPGLVTWGYYEEGSYSLACHKEKVFDNTIIDCRCPGSL